MSSQGKKRVWILGAGFSRLLGGPLLDDLLSTAARMKIRAYYPTEFRCGVNGSGLDDTSRTFWLYHFGTGFREGPFNRYSQDMHGARLWRHAEEFLEIVDRAAADESVAQLLQEAWEDLKAECTWELGGLSVKGLRHEARRVIAASCSTFVEGCTKESVEKEERWDPYRDWAKQLNQDDVVLSFNYDRVVELAGDPFVVMPDTSDVERHNALSDEQPLLYKLHGSVDWVHHEGQIVRVKPWNATELLTERAGPIAIATPGPSKKSFADEQLKKLWNRAVAELRRASWVYFVGYRFPESDPFALRKIYKNLPGVRSQVFTVLGPNTRHPDSVRLETLLSGKTRVASKALWAQDFLLKYERPS